MWAFISLLTEKVIIFYKTSLNFPKGRYKQGQENFPENCTQPRLTADVSFNVDDKI